jgi:hypothetical protein
MLTEQVDPDASTRKYATAMATQMNKNEEMMCKAYRYESESEFPIDDGDISCGAVLVTVRTYLCT